jgi:regulator of sigma E protease
MELVKSACYFIGVLSALIIAHEWGHYIVAKMCRMRVDDFSLFFGPKLICLGKRNGTEYNIRSVPLGGFVKIAGMEPDDPASMSRPIFRGINRDSAGFNWDQYATNLVGLNDESFEKVNFENVSERIVQAVYGAVGEDGRLTFEGRENLKAFSVSTGLNTDEHNYVQAILDVDDMRPDPNGYSQKPLWQRAAVIFAGPFMSLLFGYGLFCAMGFTTGLPDADNKHPAVGTVVPGKPAALAGVLPGDWILKVNGKPIDFTNVLYSLRGSIDPSDPKKTLPITLTLQRNNREVEVTMTPYVQEEQIVDEHDMPRKGKDGKLLQGPVSMIGIGVDNVWTRYGLSESVVRGNGIIKDEVSGTFKGIFSKDVKNNVGGIITIGRVIDDNSKQGPNHVLFTAAMLSVSLGLLNLFPIPVLDGGHLMLLLWEGIRRRRLTSREVYGAQVVGLFIIGCLFVFVMYNDIRRAILKQ